MIEKIYVVKYSSGSYDDFYEENIFATKSLEVASNYIHKFNSRLEYWKEVMMTYADDRGHLKDENWDIPVTNHFWTIKEMNRCFMEEVEIR
jgi:hypothetical protein